MNSKPPYLFLIFCFVVLMGGLWYVGTMDGPDMLPDTKLDVKGGITLNGETIPWDQQDPVSPVNVTAGDVFDMSFSVGRVARTLATQIRFNYSILECAEYPPASIASGYAVMETGVIFTSGGALRPKYDFSGCYFPDYYEGDLEVTVTVPGRLYRVYKIPIIVSPAPEGQQA